MRVLPLLFGACAAASILTAGCTIDTDEDGPSNDSSMTDTGAGDIGTTDTGTTDTGTTDTGTTDTGTTDTGTTDSGTTDTGDIDTGVNDTGGDADADADAATTVPGYDRDWHDDALRSHQIGDGKWVITTGEQIERFAILSVDEGRVIVQNDAENPDHGGLFSRFDLIEDESAGTLLCSTVDDAASADEAVAAATPDGSDRSLGCAGGPWISLIEGPAPIELAGVWFDGDATWTIATTTLTVDGSGQRRQYSIRAVDNEAGEAIVRADDSSDLDPSTWARFEWRSVGADVWICGVGLGSLDRTGAETAIAADDTDPANGGCGGAAWTRLTR